MSAAPRSRFLALPREVRDLIYTHYVRVDGGYTYNFVTNQLVRADGKLIDLALTRTCFQVATEMQGLALTLNKITFRTYHSEQTNESAAHFHNSLSTAQGAKYRLLDAMAPRYLTPDMSEIVGTKYPCFRPILDNWRSNPPFTLAEASMYLACPKPSWGECESLWHEFVDFTLKLLSKQPGFPLESKSIWWAMWNQYDTARLIDMQLPPPWAILGSDEAQKLQADIASATEIHGYRHPFTMNCPDRSYTYTYSAASLAVRFLNSTSQTNRQHIRDVLLDEDQESIANAPCHAQGLVPFCRENREMVIKRNVHLWTACLYVSAEYVNDFAERAQYLSAYVTLAIGSWFMETLRLSKLGMPLHSFQLVLDAGPLPKLAQKVFEAVGHDAVIQGAVDICHARSKLPPRSWVQRRTIANYTWEDLPRVYRDLIAGKLSSVIHCNFDINPGPSYEEIAEAWGHLCIFGWERLWWKYEPRGFWPEAPLPPLHLLRPKSLSSHEKKRYGINEAVPDWQTIRLQF